MKKMFFVLLFLWAAAGHAQDETVKKLSAESRRDIKKRSCRHRSPPLAAWGHHQCQPEPGIAEELGSGRR